MYFYSHEDVTITANVGHLLVANIVQHDAHMHVAVRTSFEGTPTLNRMKFILDKHMRGS